MTGSGVCVLSSRRDPDLLAKFGPFEEERAVRTVCVIVSCTLIYLMNDQAASLQRKGCAANLHRPFYRDGSSRR